jgi:hypothetical protein
MRSPQLFYFTSLTEIEFSVGTIECSSDSSGFFTIRELKDVHGLLVTP